MLKALLWLFKIAPKAAPRKLFYRLERGEDCYTVALRRCAADGGPIGWIGVR